jgi:ribosomal-protein-alanine N-acetyltransferase
MSLESTRILPLKVQVRIREPRLCDRKELIALVCRSRKLHHPWVYPPDNIAAWTAYFRILVSGRNEGYLVCLITTGEIVGVINVSEIVRGLFKSAYLGFFVHAAHAGQGYMKEGLALVLRDTFSRLRLHRLEANIQPRNAKSIGLVRSCGFRREGFSPRYLKVGGKWRDHERWAMIADECSDWSSPGYRRAKGI